jgi:hypothetical protein
MKNKKAQKASGGAIVIVIVAVILVVMFMNKSSTPVTPTTSGTCPIQPAITTPTATDALNLGSSIGGLTVSYRKNGVYVGTTAPTVQKGDSISFIAGNATTVDQIFDPAYTVDCGNNPKEITLKTYANATIQVTPDTLIGTGQYLSNAATGGAANDTKTSSGGSRNNVIRFVGNDKKTTGKMLIVVELSSPTNVSIVAMSGATSVPVPNGYTRQLTNGYAAAFEIPSQDGVSPASYNLQMSANTGYIIQGAVYTTVYAEQAFVDTDGSFKVGAFDSLNAAKWQDKQTANWFMG